MCQKDAYRRELEKIASELSEEQKRAVMAYADLYIASFSNDEVTSRHVADAFVGLITNHRIPPSTVMDIQTVDHAFTGADFRE